MRHRNETIRFFLLTGVWVNNINLLVAGLYAEPILYGLENRYFKVTTFDRPLSVTLVL